MTWRARGPCGWILVALMVAGAVCIPATAWSAAAASKIPARPKFEPVNLHAWAKANGFDVTWVEKDKKLRLKGRGQDLVVEADRREVSINGIRVFLGEGPIFAKRTLTISPIDRDRLLVPLLLPRQLGVARPVRTIMLDAGHGGKDRGTSYAPLKLLEKDFALDVVRRLQPLLEARGYRVVLTRSDDTFIELPARPARAAARGADLFLSIHFNAGPPAVTGIETYALTPQYQRPTAGEKLEPGDNVRVPGNKWDGWNALLAYSIHRQLQTDLRRFDRGLKRARFIVIRDLVQCPGVLIEGGFLSNPAEAKLIATPAYRDKLAAAIAAGVDAYTTALGLPPPSSPPPANPGASRAPRAAPR